MGPHKYFKMYKLLVAAAVAVCVSAEADPGVLVAPAPYNAYPNWPGVSTPYSQSTCYGCRPGYFYGKRSADAEAEADPALLYGAYGYGLPYANGAYPYAYGLTAAYGLAGEVAAPTASGYLNLYGKRSADAEADPALLYGAYGYGYPAYGAYPYAYGTVLPESLPTPVPLLPSLPDPPRVLARGALRLTPPFFSELTAMAPMSPETPTAMD